MDARDKKVLYLIQHRYGGTVKQISNALAFKYKLRNRAGLIALINDVNGLIRNPARLLQMNKLCVKFNIEPLGLAQLVLGRPKAGNYATLAKG